MTETLNVWQTVQSEFTCYHEYTSLVKFIKSNGAVCVREQCDLCGTNVKEVPKRGINVDTLPDWDEALRDQWHKRQEKRRNELYEQQQAMFAQQRQEQNAEWWAKYNRYLRSQQWYDMRKKVLERDGHLCQACLKNKATQVHHLSYELYEQLGKSAAFELVAICYSCHRAIHPHLADSQHNLVLHNPYLNGGGNGHN